MARIDYLWAAIAANAALSLVHGGSHETSSVPVAAWQLGIVSLAVVAVPAVGIAAGRRGHRRPAVAAVGIAALGALGFEALYHFVIHNPDHVGNATDAGVSFAVTAALSTIGDATVALVAGVVWWTTGD